MSSGDEGAAGKKWEKGLEGNWAGERGVGRSCTDSHHRPGRLLSLQAGFAEHLDFSHRTSADSVKLCVLTLLRLLVSRDQYPTQIGFI